MGAAPVVLAAPDLWHRARRPGVRAVAHRTSPLAEMRKERLNAKHAEKERLQAMLKEVR